MLHHQFNTQHGSSGSLGKTDISGSTRMPDGLCRNVPSSIDIANKQLMPEHDAELCKTAHHKNEMSGRMGYRGLDCGWQCG